MIIAIDFDGTICRSEFPTITGVMPYAKEVINRLHADGHYIIIWTCRTEKNLLDAVNWLLAEGIEFDRVNDEATATEDIYGKRMQGKIYADLYVDDKNLGGFPGWKKALEIIGSPFDDCWP